MKCDLPSELRSLAAISETEDDVDGLRYLIEVLIQHVGMVQEERDKLAKRNMALQEVLRSYQEGRKEGGDV